MPELVYISPPSVKTVARSKLSRGANLSIGDLHAKNSWWWSILTLRTTSTIFPMLDLVDHHVFSGKKLVDLKKLISSGVFGQGKSRSCWCIHMTSKWDRGLDWCLIWAKVKVFATGHEIAHLLDWFWSAAGFYSFSYLRKSSLQQQYHESWSWWWFFLIDVTVESDCGS